MAFRTAYTRGGSLLAHMKASAQNAAPASESIVQKKTPEEYVAEYVEAVSKLNMPSGEEGSRIAATIWTLCFAARDKTETRPLTDRILDFMRPLNDLARVHRMAGRWDDSQRASHLARRAESVVDLIS